MKPIMLLMLGLFALPAVAEESVVIDEKLVAGDTGIEKPSLESLEKATRESVMRGGRVSPRQQYELDRANLAEANKQTGEHFLAVNQARRGVVTLPSGVQYRIVRNAKGSRRPSDASHIVCKYQGTLIDGTTFENTASGQTETFAVAGLVPGLREAVKLMGEGARWQIVVPPRLGYGEQGNRIVSPNAVLIYDFELAAIKG